MKVAALIPARKDSRRLPEKNWQQVGGRPLWLHAVDHADKSGVCDVIVISSDDERICAEAPHCWWVSQPRFEQTYNVMLEVVRHADAELCGSNIDTDAIVILQPTSPLRTADDVRACVGLLDGPGRDAVVSVTEGADDIAFQVRHANRLEKLPSIVVPNGAVYAIKTAILRAGGSWYGPHTYAHFMPKERSVDIDTVYDLEVAQLMWDKLHEDR